MSNFKKENDISADIKLIKLSTKCCYFVLFTVDIFLALKNTMPHRLLFMVESSVLGLQQSNLLILKADF